MRTGTRLVRCERLVMGGALVCRWEMRLTLTHCVRLRFVSAFSSGGVGGDGRGHVGLSRSVREH